MDIEKISKYYSKEHIYRIYEAVTENYKKYKQITRKQCLVKIQEAYQSKEILKKFLTDHEIELIRKAYNENNVYKTFVYQELMNRMILVDDEHYAFAKINPDIENVIFELIHDDNERIGYDRYDEIIIGLIHYFGVISYEELFEFLKIYVGEYDEETMFEHISSSPIINYLFLCPEEYVICRYDLFEDYEEIMMNRSHFNSQIVLPEFNELLAISHYGFNILDPIVQQWMEVLLSMEFYSQCNIVNEMIHCAHLGNDFDFIKVYLKIFDQLSDEQIDLFEKVYETLPSASNYGLSIHYNDVQESEKIEMDEYLTNEIQVNGHLSEEDADIFYECYLSVLEFINDKYHICPHIQKIVGVPIDPKDVVEIRQVLLNHLEDIDEFLLLNRQYFNEDEISIIKNFKLMKFAHYVVVKHENDCSIFMDGERFYGVKGARAGIAEILGGVSLPTLVDAVLLPFNDKIIVDGVIQSYPIQLGNGYKKMILNNLKKARIQKQLIQYS